MNSNINCMKYFIERVERVATLRYYGGREVWQLSMFLHSIRDAVMRDTVQGQDIMRNRSLYGGVKYLYVELGDIFNFFFFPKNIFKIRVGLLHGQGHFTRKYGT